ncbi:MAG TPA: hypothetical protein VE258_20160 [Ktedonobacterales bacterium]|nr:hypothetical protein [Ktedonobacterales bacterium]
MSHPPTSAEERFALIVSVLGGTPGVTWQRVAQRHRSKNSSGPP